MESNLADVTTMTNHLWFLEEGNIVDHTLPAMRTPITPSQLTWNDPFCSERHSDGMIASSAAWRYWQLNDPFCSERLTMCCQWGAKPRNCPFPLIFRHPAGEEPSHGYRQHAQKLGKDTACGSADTLADRQTQRHTHTTCWSQYFTTAPVGKATTATDDQHSVQQCELLQNTHWCKYVTCN